MRTKSMLWDTRGAAYTETLIVLPVFIVVAGCLFFAHQTYQSSIATAATNRSNAWGYVMDGCQGGGPAGSETRETHEGLGVAAIGRVLGMFDRIRAVFPSSVRRLFPKLSFSEKELTMFDSIAAPTAAGGGEITISQNITLMCNEERGPNNMLESFGAAAWLMWGMW